MARCSWRLSCTETGRGGWLGLVFGVGSSRPEPSCFFSLVEHLGLCQSVPSSPKRGCWENPWVLWNFPPDADLPPSVQGRRGFKQKVPRT